MARLVNGVYYSVVFLLGLGTNLYAEGNQDGNSPKRARPSAIGKNLEYIPLSGGNIHYHGIDGEINWTPPLVGKDPNDPKVRKEFLDGTGFTIRVVGRQKSSTIPKGAIITQTPKEWEGVKTPGEIRVIISSGN